MTLTSKEENSVSEIIVGMRGISKSFRGFFLNGVDLTVYKGEVHALVGGNGAGKSTLMKILEGVHKPDAGTIHVAGVPVNINSIQDARDLGLAMIFQEFSLVSTLTVSQNIFLTRERQGLPGLIDDERSRTRTLEIFQDLGVSIDPDALVSQLSTGQRQLTEIAKAMSQEVKVLVMDEPTASLTHSETVALFQLIQNLKSRGIAIIYISHRMDEIFAISDRITVLRGGQVVATGEASEFSMPDLIDHIVGRKVKEVFRWIPRTVDRTSTPLLKAQNICSGTQVQNISFDLYPGEILGIAGLMGAGRTELLQTLFGVRPMSSGRVTVKGVSIRKLSCKAAMSAGLALVPEDRRVQGLVLEHSVRDNIIVPVLSALSPWGFVNEKRVRQWCDGLVTRLQVKTKDLDQPVGQLSGGNQQKVVLAKWMGREPTILMLDEPTAGIDIGAKTDIVLMIRELAEDPNRGVIFVSSEVPEMLAVCDRILVLKDGKLIESVERGLIDDEKMLHTMMQGR
jgi:ribose transport system ATP-binding protein